MAKTKKQHLDTVFQRQIDAGKAVGGVLMILSALVLALSLIFVDEYSKAKPALLLYSLIGIVIGFFILLIFMSRQDLADQLSERLYAVWHYDPQIIYKFFRVQAKKQKPTRFYNGLITTLVLVFLTVILSFDPVTRAISTVTLVLSILSGVISLTLLPYAHYLFLVFCTTFFGSAKEVIFSRLGLWYCGRVYNFGKNGVTYHRVERKEIHGIDCIVFFYTRKLGQQSYFREIVIPVLPKMAYNADELVAEFNKSDILTFDEKAE